MLTNFRSAFITASFPLSSVEPAVTGHQLPYQPQASAIAEKVASSTLMPPSFTSSV